MSLSPYTFNPPTSLAQAEDRRLATVFNVQNIEAQLSDRNRKIPGGARMTTQAYHEWRAKSVTALKFQQAELRALNSWIKKVRLHVMTNTANILDPLNPISYLTAANTLFDRFRHDVDLDPDEIAVADAIRAFLRHVG